MDDVDGHTATDERLREDEVGNLRQWDHRDGDRGCHSQQAAVVQNQQQFAVTDLELQTRPRSQPRSLPARGAHRTRGKLKAGQPLSVRIATDTHWHVSYRARS